MKQLEKIAKCSTAIIATEYGNLPDVFQRHYFQQPAATLAVSSEILLAGLSNNTSYRRLSGLPKRAVRFTADCIIEPQDYLPKLGVVSWKDCVGMAMLPKGLLHPESQNEVLSCWLTNLSDRMAQVLHAYVADQVTPRLYLFPYHDFSARSEYRLAVSGGALLDARCYRQRQDFQAGYREAIKKWWLGLGDHVAQLEQPLLIDVVLDTSRGFAIIDVNPNLQLYQ
ncbi:MULTISPECIES: hypothetical protein [Grimontia]|uniref:ATP-grasp domain-containing protein n=1 Tax=Grimontia marina TaxID=646534 RepID=A0A128FHJ4_9GAMM|nr:MULTISPECIES: hypothetical protein [Grimontia]CZF85774.1 hypothetical protein GMA8713_03807 [Grimontia marina]